MLILWLKMENLRTAFVAGGSKGIGLATAQVLAKLGYTIILAARTEEALKDAIVSLDTSEDQEHMYIMVDFSKPERLEEIMQATTANTDIHVLINNTGGPAGGLIQSATSEAFIKAFNMHLICNQILAKACLPGMKRAGFGRIINIISTSVKQPLDGLGVSNTIRGSVANWAKTWANEVGQYGITVNNVLPGATETGRLIEIIEAKAQKMNLSTDEVREKMQSIIPAKRFGKPEEIADAVAFLASEKASYINGINLPVDGGRTKSL